MLLLFLQNTIESQTKAPTADENNPTTPVTPASPGLASDKRNELKLKLPAWQDFKQLIYEIYDHRIYHAPEINGAINTNYMGMDEHLICFFIEKY